MAPRNRPDPAGLIRVMGKKPLGMERHRAHKASIGLPPLQRVKRAPGEINPRKGKRGGLNRQGKMIE